MPGRILGIRGGALGDFILTLPAMRLLRENFKNCALDILGYRHIAVLAEGRYYADSTRSIEYGPLAGFFNPKASLDPDLCAYFAGFRQIISYIYDPDGLFAGGLRRAGVRNLLSVSPKIDEDEHAARQLARPLEQLALRLENPAARIFPSGRDLADAQTLVSTFRKPLVAIHPGSGGERKNWPLDGWLKVQRQLLDDTRVGHLLIIGGESDSGQLARMRPIHPVARQMVLESLPLPLLGAILSRCDVFIGHDSGISHLAAAAGARCLLLFGPTNPEVWAPANPEVSVLRAPGGQLSNLETATVLATMSKLLDDAFRNNSCC
ncbi:MAG TPA: glycosyltransferase family 9 protein [Terrimicrobiaceae bacterium]